MSAELLQLVDYSLSSVFTFIALNWSLEQARRSLCLHMNARKRSKMLSQVKFQF